jgi:hypothetical protein
MWRPSIHDFRPGGWLPKAMTLEVPCHLEESR